MDGQINEIMLFCIYILFLFHSASYKYPWAKVFSYRGGQGKAGRMPLQEVVRYPNETPQSANPQYCGGIFPTLVVPTDRIHFKLAGSTPPPGRQLNVYGLPRIIPVLLTVTNTLSIQSYRSFQCDKKSSKTVLQYCHALSTCVTPLLKVITGSTMPIVMKERLFHSFANILTSLVTIDVVDHAQCPAIPAGFIQSISEELENLYNTECEQFLSGGDKTKKGHPFPPAGSIGRGGSGRFSTYFQSLLELVLGVELYINHYHKPKEATPTSNGKRVSKKGKQVKKTTWLSYVRRAFNLLHSITHHKPLNNEFYKCYYKSLSVSPQSRLLVVTGISPGLEGNVAMETITKICNHYGGLNQAGTYLPLRERTEEEKEAIRMKLEEENKKLEIEESTINKEESSDDKEQSDTQPQPEAQDESQEEKDSVPKAEATPPTNEPVVVGGAVIELCSGSKTSSVCSALLSSAVLQGEKKVLSVLCVSDTLRCGEDETANEILTKYLTSKIFTNKKLSEEARGVFKSIFNSSKTNILRKNLEDDNSDLLLKVFLHGVSRDRSLKDILNQLWQGKKDTDPLTEEHFLGWVEKEGLKNVLYIWTGLFAAGYDCHLTRYR